MRYLLLLLPIVLAGCGPSSIPTTRQLTDMRAAIEKLRADSIAAVGRYSSAANSNIENLDTSAVDVLRGLPGVARVDVKPAAQRPAAQRIIQIVDCQRVTKPEFAADLGVQFGRTPHPSELEACYSQKLCEWERVNVEQTAALLCLIRHHGLKHLCLANLPDGYVERYYERVAGLRVQDEIGADTYRIELLSLGCAAEILIAGEKLEILPLDDFAMLQLARPNIVKGKNIPMLAADIEKREDEMLRRLRQRPVSICILAGAHDLADNIARSGLDAEYIRVQVNSWQSTAKAH